MIFSCSINSGVLIKRIFDLIFSFIGLLILSPLFFVIPILIKSDSSGPIIFKQARVGLMGKRFLLYKFRTMVKDAEKKGIKLTSSSDSRITKVGRFLRKYKIDEYPQLINILKGEMSFVGPRPEVPEYVELFRGDFDYILQMKPGITDFASIKYRNESNLIKNGHNAENIYINEILTQKIQLYKKYIKERSFSLHLKLIFFTLFYLIKK